jgi:hypothetical protein
MIGFAIFLALIIGACFGVILMALIQGGKE